MIKDASRNGSRSKMRLSHNNSQTLVNKELKPAPNKETKTIQLKYNNKENKSTKLN
jgi:hypothetical protein